MESYSKRTDEKMDKFPHSTIEKKKEECDDRNNRTYEIIANMRRNSPCKMKREKVKLMSSTKFMKTRNMVKP